MKKLEKIADRDISTAFKRCNNIQEANRYKRTFHELTNLQ